MRKIESKSLALYKNLINDSENYPIICEPSGPSSELFDSLIHAYKKLIELGFTYYNGKVSSIDIEEEDSNE